MAPLAEGAKVDAQERKGGWTRVKAPGGAEGWVRMLQLRYGSGEAKQGDTGVSQLLNVARTGSSGTQVTTGVRGLPMTPAGWFSLCAARYFDTYGAGREDLAKIAVKNHHNGTLAPKSMLKRDG